MKQEPKALDCNHCVVHFARVEGAPQWRAVSRAATESLNRNTTKLFDSAFHLQGSQYFAKDHRIVIPIYKPRNGNCN